MKPFPWEYTDVLKGWGILQFFGDIFSRLFHLTVLGVWLGVGEQELVKVALFQRPWPGIGACTLTPQL